MDKSYITESTIEKYVIGNEVNLTKRLYIECDCGSFSDMARMTICREFPLINTEKNSNFEEDGYVDIELNATGSIHPSKIFRNKWDHIIYPFEVFFRRIAAAYNLLMGKPAWIPANIMLSVKGARDLSHYLYKSLEEMRDVQVGHNKQSQQMRSSDILG
jgi:hypothetical protein